MSAYRIYLAPFLTTLASLAFAQPFVPPGMSLWEYSAWFQNQEAYNVGIDEEGSERAQFDKFMSTWGPRLFPTGNFNQVGLASQEHIAYLSARFGNDGIYASSWTSIGPNESPLGPAGEVLARSTGTGQIHAIAFHPEFASNGIMYCASSYGGLFRSADHGSSWSAIADEREFTPVSAIVVSQIDPNVVFISTGGSDNVLAYCTGVWRSTDGGDTWESISGGLDIDMTNRQHILNMAVDPANQDLAIAATTEGLYRTTNAMAPANQVQWTEVFDSPTGNFWKGLFFKEGTTVVYAADANVYRSTDQGLTWTAITGPTTGLEPSTLSPAGTRINLAPEKGASSTKVYAMLQQGYSTQSRAYVYDETTETWSGGTIIASGGTSVGWIPIATTTVAGQDQFITYGGLRLYKSTNGGTTVSLFGDGLLQNPDTYERIHDDQQVAAFTPDGAELWIGNHGGIHRCTNPFGATPLWENRNIGLGVGLVTALASDPTHPSSIISGEFDNGVRRLLPSAPTENRWRHLVFGDGGSVAIDPTGRHHYGTDERYLPVVKLFDGAIDPNCITGGWLTNTCPKLLHAEGWYTAGARRPMEFDEHDAKLVLGYSDIWKEVNSEAPATAQMDQFSRHSHWQNVDFSTNEFACDQRAWVDLAIAPGNEEGVYGLTVSYVCSAGVQESRLLRRAAPIVINSTGQPALELVDLPFPNMAATQVTIDPLNAHRIWVTISGYSADKKVFHSSDRGDTWTNWDPLGSLPNLPVNDIVYQNGTEDGLYIATDAGVYYRNGSEAEVAWEPFYAALPNVRVNDLDINYCAGKLRAGTWGRGLWESDLAEQPTVARVITENTTWSIHKNLTQDVRVMPGATLTITNTVNFAPNTALIIEPGASVIVDGGLLHNSCGKEWKGVQVLGNSNLAQNPSNQGYFELRNGGVVDNAAIGILVGDLNDLTKGGGVVKIKGTQAQPGGVVRDCRPAVQFRPYGQISNMQFETRNRSQFVHAVFEFTEGALQAELGTEELIKLDGVRGIAFQACTFRNTIANVPETHLLGHGLHTYGSRFVVTDACPTPGTPCTAAERVPTSFTGLDHGVHALGAPTNSMFTLENSSFSNTICGVYASGITGFTVRNNDFEITDRAIAFTHPTEEFWFGMPRGIYTYESFGFKLHDNVVHSEQANPVLPAEAIVVGYSRDHNDKIWKNTATNLSTGFVGEGVCASTEPGGYSAIIGLQKYCNTNSNVDKNLYSRKVEGQADAAFHTIRTIQASAGRGADNTLDGWSGETEKWDFYVDTDHPITYYYRTGTGLFPEHVSDLLLPAGIPYGMSSECTPHLISVDPGVVGVAGMLVNARTDYGETRYLYEQLIDGGNTDAVVEEIVSAWPQDVWELRTYLLSKSPYLSTEALMELVNKQVPEAIKAEICIANPDATKKEGFLRWAEYDALYPLPPHLIASIAASWETHTYRTTLEAQMGEHHARMTEAVNELLDLYATRDSTGVENDSLRWVWAQVPTVAARYAEALLRVQAEDFSGAQALMDDLEDDHKLSIAEEAERARMTTLVADLLNLEQQARDLRQLDPAEVAAWESLIQDQYNRPATWISNTLCFHYGICRPPLTGGESEPKRLIRDTKDDGAKAQRSFKLQPNPASTYVSLNYSLLPSDTEGGLRVLDPIGRVIATDKLQSAQGQALLDTRQWARGAYTVQCTVAGALVHTEKLIIQ